MSIGVKVEDGNVERALARFRRKVKDSNLVIELREREFFVKPSEERRTKMHLGKRRTQARERAKDV